MTRAVELLAQLTLEEKASLCLGADFWQTRGLPRVGLESVVVSDGPHGLRRQPERGDHTGSGASLPATCFPTAAALGSSWDPALVRRIGEALAVECHDQGVSVLLGPGINIKRSPLCGRNFEYFSEDPHLSGVLGVAMVNALQGSGVGASLKHFAVNNQETDRLRVSADVDMRTLREIYLPAFERVVTEAAPWTVMCAYNKVNGTYASEHHWLLTELLRGEWDFDGLVVSDWGAVHDRVASLAAGLDLEMPPNLGVSDAAVTAAVQDGGLDESILDASARRVLALVDRARAGERPAAPTDVDAHHALARSAAAQCAVLLKNDDAILPLQPGPGETVAVIGEFARTPRFQGGGSSRVNPTRVDVPLDELRAGLPDTVDVIFEPGYGIDETGRDADLADAAVALAARADTVVLFLGLSVAEESEGYDRQHMDLSPTQAALVPRLAAVNPHLVVVLANGSAVRLSGWQDDAQAILECWLGGQAAGGAVADLLLGAADPGGRLAETIPVRLEDTPAQLNFPGGEGHVRYGEGVFVGYRAYDTLGQEVSYPFGHGLSYTSFTYTGLEVAVSGGVETDDLAVDVSALVTNTGERRGQEVVQLYVGDDESSVARPVHELKGFTKLDLLAGETAPVSFRLTARDLSYWSVEVDGWHLEAGAFSISLGASCRDLRLTATVEVAAPPIPTQQLNGMSTLAEWLADSGGGPALRATIGLGPDGRPRGILANERRLRVIGNFPLRTLAAFHVGFTHADVDALVEAESHRPQHS